MRVMAEDDNEDGVAMMMETSGGMIVEDRNDVERET